MQIVLFNENKHVLYKIEKVSNPIVDENKITWDTGSVIDTDSFILLEDDVEIGEVVTDDLIALDQRANFIMIPDDEEEIIKTRLDAAENAIITLMDFM